MSPKQHRRSLHLAAAQERAPGVLCVRERPLILKQHCQCLCVCAYICANVFLCMFICLYVSVFLYIYTYIYMHTYICIYIYTCIHASIYHICNIVCKCFNFSTNKYCFRIWIIRLQLPCHLICWGN